MTKGLWLSPTDFSSFAGDIKRQDLVEDIASRDVAWDWTGDLGLLPDPDPVLRKLGEGDAVLESLLADDKVCSVVQTRKVGTLNKEFSWEPGTLDDNQASPEAEKLRNNLVKDLERVDMLNLISGLLDAPYYGMTPVEIKWEYGDGRFRIKDLEVKPARWFGFTDKNEPRFISMNNPWDGETLPFGKFVLARHLPTYDNPFGLRLLSRCFWPVAFKKGGVKFWVTLAEKYGMPFLVGKYQAGTGKETKEEFLANLSKMVRDAVALIPNNGSVELIETSKGGQTSDIHRQLVAEMNGAIAQVIMGQTLTAEVGDTGSYAASKTHENVLEDYRQADQKLVKTALEEIAWLYALVNSPGTPSPSFKWFEEEDVQKDRAVRDQLLQKGDTRLKLNKNYYVRTYGFKEDDFDLVELQDAKPKPAGGTGKDSEFAEADMDLLDELLDDETLGNGAVAIESVLAPVFKLVGSSESLSEIRAGLSGLFSSMDTGAFINDLAVSQFKARGIGDADASGADFAEKSFPGPVPKEALSFFRNKDLKISFDYRDVWREEHAASFTVAKAMQLDVLQAIRDEVDNAIANGQTLQQFRKNLTPRLQALGWWGRQEVTDPLTGEILEAQLGSPRRLKTIYRANLRSAYAAGQYQRAQRTKAALPYFRYELGPSRDHRPEHAALEGTILPVDHPFWQTHMPPNGWGCKCRVRQISKVEMTRRDWSVSPEPQVKMRNWINNRTGEIEQIPEGIDPGWDVNHGRTRLDNLGKMLAGKLETVDPSIAQAALKDLVSSDRFKNFIERPLGQLPVLRLSGDITKAIGAEESVASLSAESLEKNLKHHPDLTIDDYRRLPEIGADPTLIVQDGEQTVVLVKQGERIYWAAVKATRTGRGLFVTSLRLTRDKNVKDLLRKGKKLYGEWPIENPPE